MAKEEGTSHSLTSLLKQRVFQIACGYEDQNDSDTLREDPLLKMVCGSMPEEEGPDLASQPTICRLENSATRRSCRRIAEVLFELYLSEREKDGAPEKVLLDFDATDATPSTEKIRKARTTTAITASICITPYSSSTARAGI